MKITIVIDPQGNAYFIANDSAKGFSKKQRVSHVLPENTIQRIAFRIIRWLVKDESKAAEWTRNWKCTWYSDLSPVKGPTFRGFTDRKKAIEAEVDWLVNNSLGVKNLKG